jgi:hypothetical protein
MSDWKECKSVGIAQVKNGKETQALTDGHILPVNSAVPAAFRTSVIARNSFEFVIQQTGTA